MNFIIGLVISVVIFLASVGIVVFGALILKWRDIKKWSRNEILSFVGVIIAVFIFLMAPVRDEAYKFFASKKYLNGIKTYNKLITKFSVEMPDLAIRPLYLLLYHPKYPQVERQIKGLILAQIELRNKEPAKNIQVDFIVNFGRGQDHSSMEWNKVSGQQSLIFSMFYPSIKFVTWSPDMPHDLKELTQNSGNPPTLRLKVTWEDKNNKQHALESYSILKYSEENNLFYFTEKENKLIQ